MIIQTSDTISTAADSLLKASENLNQISFDMSRITAGDNIMISVVGYVTVFIALLLLYLMFHSFSKMLHKKTKKQLMAKGEKAGSDDSDSDISGEISAAISMALHLHLDQQHDFENTILTIKKVQRAYSPWSSKIYGLRELPKK